MHDNSNIFFFRMRLFTGMPYKLKTKKHHTMRDLGNSSIFSEMRATITVRISF